MASKSKSGNLTAQLSKHELEVEKLRDENKWNRLKEYAHAIPPKETKYGQ
jgi:hypothetical protein